MRSRICFVHTIFGLHLVRHLIDRSRDIVITVVELDDFSGLLKQEDITVQDFLFVFVEYFHGAPVLQTEAHHRLASIVAKFDLLLSFHQIDPSCLPEVFIMETGHRSFV